MGLQVSCLVFIPNRWKKKVFGVLRRHLGDVFHELVKQKESKIEEEHLHLDHVHICISIPPKYVVSNVVAYIRGKSTISVARSFAGRRRNFTGENFSARRYFNCTAGLDEEAVRGTAVGRKRKMNA
jgi:putative transposase